MEVTESREERALYKAHRNLRRVCVTEKYQRGLTWRSVLALVFGGLIVEPAIIYYYLVTGLALPLSTWIVILVFSEIARAFGRPLTKQEIFIILSFETLGLLGYAWVFVMPVKNLYFAHSGITEAFGLSELIPTWWSPPRELYIDLMRMGTFFHTSWLLPVIALIAIPYTFGVIANITMGYFSYSLYVSVEKLTFPAQAAAAQTIVALSEREPRWVRPLYLAVIVGILYNGASTFSEFLLGYSFIKRGRLGIGTGWAPSLLDFTAVLETIPGLRGAQLGFTSDLTFYVTGMLLPLSITVFMVIGAFSFYFFGNIAITALNLWPPEFPWRPGLGMTALAYRSTLYFWTSVFIGLALAVAFVPILIQPQKLVRAFRGLSIAGKEAGGTSIWLLLAMFLVSTLGTVALVYFLVPGFPVWLLIVFIAGLSFFITFVQTQSAGVTYGGFNIPYLREMMIYYSGYRGFDIWLAPVSVYTGGTSFCGAFLQADVCEVKHSEYVKASFITVGLGVIMSFIYMTLFMKMAEIPSIAYPYTIIRWPVETMEWARWQSWLWSGLLFKYDLILGSLGIGAVLSVLGHFLHAPYALVSILMGGLMGAVPGVTLSVSPLALTIAQLSGSLMSTYVFARILGVERWKSIRPVVVMGFMIGDGLMWALQAALMLTSKSMWLLPY